MFTLYMYVFNLTYTRNASYINFADPKKNKKKLDLLQKNTGSFLSTNAEQNVNK